MGLKISCMHARTCVSFGFFATGCYLRWVGSVAPVFRAASEEWPRSAEPVRLLVSAQQRGGVVNAASNEPHLAIWRLTRIAHTLFVAHMFSLTAGHPVSSTLYCGTEALKHS